MLKFNPTTPVKFFAKTSVYVPGEGQSVGWSDIGTMYCEWRGSYGDRVTAAQALGVGDSATVRTFYRPEVYNALRSTQVIVLKNGIGEPTAQNPNAYELWGGVDNVAEENQFIEFRVRRYEAK